jgi:colanic acid biosynthesis glycosyl transferase WcaI
MPSNTINSALVVSQHYWPEPIGSAPYVTDLANWLAQKGSRVHVFTCRPHYPEGKVPRAYRYGRRDVEAHKGILIERIPPFQPGHRGTLGRVIREGLFLLHGLWALATGRIQRSPFVVSLCPSIFAVLLGVAARRPDGCHTVLVHDIQSGLAAGLGMVGRFGLPALMRWFERVVLERADLILVLSHNMRTTLRNQGVRAPIEVLPIWVDTTAIRPERAPRSDVLTVMYSGNFGRKQGLMQIVDMAERLQQRGSPVRILLRGEGSEGARIAAEISTRGLRHVRLAPLTPPDELSSSLAQGAIHFVPQDANAADFAVPSKVYAIMASGRPFVATARPGSQLWDLSVRSQAFLCVPAGDTDAIADAVERLARDPAFRIKLGCNGRRYALRHHDKALVLGRFHALATAQNAALPWRLRPSHIS